MSRSRYRTTRVEVLLLETAFNCKNIARLEGEKVDIKQTLVWQDSQVPSIVLRCSKLFVFITLNPLSLLAVKLNILSLQWHESLHLRRRCPRLHLPRCMLLVGNSFLTAPFPRANGLKKQTNPQSLRPLCTPLGALGLG